MTTLSAKTVRICLTAIVAFVIARLSIGPLFVVLWPGLYWGWGYLGRRRAAHGLGTFLWQAEQKSPITPIATKHSDLRRAARVVGITFAAITFAGVVLVFISIESDKRQANEARARIQDGMIIGEVLDSTSTGAFLWANADYPETARGRARAVNLAPGSQSGTFSYFDDALSKDREITAQEALAILHQRLGDGIPWRVEYFFAGHSLEHFSFKVVFDKDGRVREVTPLYGSFE